VSAGWVMIEKLLWMTRDHKKRLDATKSKLVIKAMIYEKITNLSPGSNKKFTEGEILGLLSTGNENIEFLFYSLSRKSVWIVISVLGPSIMLGKLFGWTYLLMLTLCFVALSITTHL
jgi:ABC-type transport system involved in cytochrome bd biosynthesis fused ATPase/permease subunit